jgi:hypothetical protein
MGFYHKGHEEHKGYYYKATFNHRFHRLGIYILMGKNEQIIFTTSYELRPLIFCLFFHLGEDGEEYNRIFFYCVGGDFALSGF